MKKIAIIFVVAAIGMCVWYYMWLSSIEPHIKRIEASIAHYNQQFAASAYRPIFQASAITPSGFPLSTQVTIANPSLAMQWGGISYQVEADSLRLRLEDEAQGRYRLEISGDIKAHYTESDKVDESYHISGSNMPVLWTRVKDTPFHCKGEHCYAKPEDLLSQIGFELQGDVMLEVILLTEMGKNPVEKIVFSSPAIPKPIFMAIPSDASRPLSLFVGMLREAFIFKTKP